MRHFALLFLCLVGTTILAVGQTYGNEWIDYDQTYYKFSIGADGIYKISHTTLSNHGIDVSNIKPQNIKLFKNGEEQQIYVHGESDGSFDALDYIEFIGYKNDGSLDEELYRSAAEHTNPFYSLYSDTAIYFLTFSNNASTKHLTSFSDKNFIGKSGDSHINYMVTKSFQGEFFAGIPNSNDPGQNFSEYTDGEGYLSTKTSNLTEFVFNTPAAIAGKQAQLKVVAYGRNNASDYRNGHNHGFGVAIGSSSNLIKTIEHSGYSAVKLDFSDLTFSSNLMTNSTSVFVGEVERNNSLHSISYMQLKYDRGFDLNQEAFIHFTSIGTSSYVKFTNYNSSKGNPIIYDLTSQNRILGDLKAGTLQFNVASTGAKNIVIFDGSDITEITSLQTKKYLEPIFTSSDYLIISNRKLENSVLQYSSYREGIQGGGHRPKVLYASDIYDLYFYGYHHPLAVKHCIAYQQNALNEKIKHVLIIGKGQMYDAIRFNITKKNQLDLVPTIGNPPSDYLLVSDLSAKNLEITVPIGRISATNDQQVLDYLDKVKAHESEPYGEWWKKMIQIAGGSDLAQNTTFTNFLNKYYDVASDSMLGAKRVFFSKNEAKAVSSNLIEEIQTEINSGTNIFNYFGHGSAQVLEVEIGDPGDLNNYGKYPLFIFNGCALGNSYVDNSLVEDYFFTKSNGAINWVASTGFGFARELVPYTTIFHQHLLQKSFGESIGTAIKNTIKEYQLPNDNINVMNSRQLVYHGDPALKIHIPANPDITIKQGRINTDFSVIDDISLSLDVYNLGITTSQPTSIHIYANNGNTNQLVYNGQINVPNYVRTDTISLQKSSFYSGLVTFTIVLDSFNTLTEIQPDGEGNNHFSFQQLFELKKPLLLYPHLNEIIHSSSTEFLFQIVNPDFITTKVVIELDTAPDFSSPVKIEKEFTTQDQIVKKEVSMPPFNNVDYFYRVKTIQNDIESEWSTSSFAYLFKKRNGWSEGHTANFDNASKNSIEYDSSTMLFDFTKRISNNYGAITHGSNQRTAWNLMIIAGEVNIIRRENSSGIQIVAINPNSEKRISTNSKFNRLYPPYPAFPYNPYWAPNNAQENQLEYYQKGEKTGVYTFRTNNKVDRDSFLQFLKSIPDDYHILMHNEIQADIESWEQEIFDELLTFGIKDLSKIKNDEPFIVFGTKGDPDFSKEKYADYGNGVDPKDQRIEMSTNIFPKSSTGFIQTELVGPSSKWYEAELTLINEDSPKDDYKVSVIGLDKQLNETTLFSNQTSNNIDISSVDAKNFPFLKMRIDFSDSTNYTPYSIGRWTIYHDGVNEGIVDRQVLDTMTADTIQQGQMLTFGTAFRNVSSLIFDSCKVQSKIVDQNGKTTFLPIKQLNPIASGEYVYVRDTINTEDLPGGNYKIFSDVNYNQEVLENQYINNLYFKDVYIKTDDRNPLLDVTFDGVHIFNRDIVSANTVITITGKDENEFLLLNDPSLFSVRLKYPNDSVFILDQTDPMFEFRPATSQSESAVITYNTQDLKDGIYTLEVSLIDRSENGKENSPYAIDFQVISKQSISNLYPYPNPFTSCAKFVFTCTGSEVPDRMLISIYTISGKLVRQIDETELGPLRIGNNLTDYCWDGTDEFGDKLANGVYLYKADIYSGGKRVELYETSNDQLFNNGFGKLYIAR